MLAALLLSASSAALYAAAFPPWDVSPWAWIALAPLFVAATRVTPGRAAFCGALWGLLAAYGVGTWFPGMVTDYFQQPVWMGWGGFLLAAVSSASVFYGALAAWLSWASRRRSLSPLVVAAGFGACELARGRLLFGNPWALAGYSQVEWLAFSQIADVAGPYGCGMVLAAVNAALAGVVAPTLRARRPWSGVAAVAVVVAATLMYGRWRLTQTAAGGEPFEVAIVQGAITRGHRWQPEYQRLGVDRYVALTREAAAVHPRLVVWPEYAVSLYLQEPSAERDEILAVARESGADLVLGGPRYEFAAAETVYHNSIFLIRDGRLAGAYDKALLIPIAETMLAPRGTDPDRTVLASAVARVGAMLCWEAMHPGFVREFARRGADVLANLSNDAWLNDAGAARLHLRMAVMRAIENRRWLLRAASTGISAIVDPHGRVVAESGFGSSAVLTASVRRSQAVTIYQRWGDLVAWLAVAVTAIVTGARVRRP